MFGGTPTNIAAMFLDDKNIEVITGVNLPMLIKFASADAGDPLKEVARRVRDGGRDGIHLAGELLAPQKASMGAGGNANPQVGL
jgi:PTS system mannose-specific IIA component